MALRKTHKHAELIKVWADGAEIQVFDNIFNSWFDVIDNKPSWDFEHEYRIKPEPKPDVVAKGIIEWGGNTANGVADYDTDFRVSEHWERDNIKLTFDGETGKLKSAEVLK